MMSEFGIKHLTNNVRQWKHIVKQNDMYLCNWNSFFPHDCACWQCKLLAGYRFLINSKHIRVSVLLYHSNGALLLCSTLNIKTFPRRIKNALPPLPPQPPSRFYKLHFNIILPLRVYQPRGFIPWGFPTTNLKTIGFTPMHSTYPTMSNFCEDHLKDVNNTVINMLRKYTDEEEVEKFMKAKCCNFVTPYNSLRQKSYAWRVANKVTLAIDLSTDFDLLQQFFSSTSSLKGDAII
jgi:hypothetical protein